MLRAISCATAVFFATTFVYAQDVRSTIGPLEQSATPSSPENPIPRRTAAPQAMQPQEWQGRSGRGLVRLQATLDTSGRVAEMRNLMDPLVQFPVGVAANETTRRAIADAMLKSSATALRQWTYEAPAAPITFPVLFNFNASAEPVAIQDPPAPGLGLARGALPAGSPAPWPAANGAVRVGRGIAPPKQLKKVNPVYPQAAIAERVQGVVITEAVIGVNGKVTDVRVLRSIPLLDKAAVDAVMQWEYTPTLLDGQATPILMSVTLSFSLNGPPGNSPAGPLMVDPWPAADGAVRVGGTIAAPRKTKDVSAVYPIGAQAQRRSGAVVLDVLVGPNGTVTDVRVIRSSPLFDKSAVDAVKKWEYEPTLVNGVPVSVVFATTVTFTLR